MARSLVGGMIANGYDRSAITVSDPVKEALIFAANTWQINTTSDNQHLIANSNTVVLAVKPQVMQNVLETCQVSLQQHKPLLISIAAGILIDSIENWSGGELPIVRVMPNTPALIQRGISGIHTNSRVTTSHKKQVETILSAVGKTVWLEDESELDAITAVSGSGPAYFFYLIEAIEQAAIDLGLDPKIARNLATETAVGAAHLAADSQDSAEVLRKRVTSPGGTTEAALKVLETQDVKAIVIQAIKAAEQKSIEMSRLPSN